MILNGIPCYDSVLLKEKEYCLFQRLNAVFREIERIEKISSSFKQLSTSSEKEERRIIEKFIALFKESNNSLKIDYDCFNDEIHQIERIMIIDKPITEVNIVGNKLISRGWKGTIAFLGESKSIIMISQIVENFFNKLEENEAINLWISDDLNNIMFKSKFGGSACFLNPIYNDFYLYDIYDDNINQIHKDFVEKLSMLKHDNTSENLNQGNLEKGENKEDNKNIFDIKF